MDVHARFQATYAAARELSGSLVGLPADEASRQATEAGFRPEQLGPDVTMITLDLRADRIRLFLDPDGIVVKAEAG